MYQVTASTRRKKWTSEMNRKLMECYIESKPEVRGYKKRLTEIWHRESMIDVTEQRLVDQIRQIKLKGWLTEIEIEVIKKMVLNTVGRNEQQCNEESVVQEDQEQESVDIIEEEIQSVLDFVEVDGQEF